jgi:hypothetical protein
MEGERILVGAGTVQGRWVTHLVHHATLSVGLVLLLEILTEKGVGIRVCLPHESRIFG